MTWALAEVAQLFAVSYSVRASLKRLKRLASCPTEEGGRSLAGLQECLMFWVVHGLCLVFERHFEVLVRWFPGYYYLKVRVRLAVKTHSALPSPYLQP